MANCTSTFCQLMLMLALAVPGRSLIIHSFDPSSPQRQSDSRLEILRNETIASDSLF